MAGRIEALVSEWRSEALTLRHRYSDERLASVCEAHALELETALRTSLDESVTLQEASRISGYSYAHLRRLMDSGAIRNVGKRGAPRVRVGDLPYRPSRMLDARATKV